MGVIALWALGVLGISLSGTARPRRWRRPMFHVPRGVSYAIENSQWGTRVAKALGFWWIDKDCHVTMDGVWVFGHWGLITKNGFILPKWFRSKYGLRPKISDVTWADLHQLQTGWTTWRGKTRRFRFVRAEDGLRLIAALRMGVMTEQKGNPAFRTTQFWINAGLIMKKVGLPNHSLVVGTLPGMAGAGRVLEAAHAVGRETMVIRAQDGVPKSWAPHMDWYRGAIKWTDR